MGQPAHGWGHQGLFTQGSAGQVAGQLGVVVQIEAILFGPVLFVQLCADAIRASTALLDALEWRRRACSLQVLEFTAVARFS